MALSQPAQPETQPVELELDAPCELQLSFAGASLDHQEHAGQLVESDESHLDASSMPPPQPPSKKQKKQKSDIGESDNKSVTSSDAPSKTASTSKDLIGVKKFGRGYTRQCKGCQLWFKPEGMASKSSFCSKDKNKLDNLSRLAKAQGKAKWLSEARRDEDKISKILKKYSEMSGDAGTPGGKKQVPRATLFSTLEKTVATSRVMYDTKHRFMPEDAYVKHVTEVLLEGEGRLTKAQATLQWQQWSTLISENPETEEVMWDKKGSGGQLRVAVAIEDNLHLSNIYDRAKEFSSKGKDEKSLTEDQISQRKRQLFVNHDSGHDVDAKAIGQSMVRASGSSTAGNSFCALASELDVDELEPRKDDSPEGIEGSGGEESQEESNVRPQAKAKAKAWPKAKARTEKAESRKGWFDRDTAIASKARSETTALCGLQVQMSNKLKEAQAQMDEVATKPSESQHEVCVENDTLLRRMTFLEAMLDDDSTKLKELIQQQVTDKSCMEGKDDENGDGQSSWQAQVSRAPPCQSFEDLVTLASIKGSLDDYWKCTSANELRDVARQRTLSRKPITELVGAVNVGIKELKKALTALEQRNAKRNLPPSTATGPGRKRSKTAAVHPSAFEAGLDKGNTFNSIASDALSALSSDQVNLSLPLIVKFTSLAALLSDASIKQSVDSFDAAFARHVKSNEKSNMTKPPEARSKVRAASPLFSAEANDAWASFCTSNFMAHMVPEEVGAVGKSVLHVGVQAGASTGAAEKGWQASLRLSISGTKTILACSAETAIATFGVMDPTALWQKFLQMSPEDVQRMVDLQRKEITLWAGTVGPNELFYLPAGWMFAESVLPKADCMGILCRGVINEGSAYNQLQAIRKLLSSVKKNDAELDAVVAALAALEKRALASTVPTEPEPAALASPWPKPSPGESASPSGKKADDVDDVEAHGGGSEIPVEQLAAQDSQSQQLTA